jgi:hypothetical protein
MLCLVQPVVPGEDGAPPKQVLPLHSLRLLRSQFAKTGDFADRICPHLLLVCSLHFRRRSLKQDTNNRGRHQVRHGTCDHGAEAELG